MDSPYSCETAAQTLEWMNAITDFLRPYKHILDAHVVNFFKDRLWETVDEQWMECLRKESVDNLMNIPSGFIQDYWPASLREFVLTLRSLVILREPKLSHTIIPDLHVTSLSNVLAQGMNLKKKHEVEILAAVIKTVAAGVGSETIIDVGAGQGYLAQVLSFQYGLSVVAIDASLHHATVTSARTERIKKHYAAQLRKSQVAGNTNIKLPLTVTSRVLSSDTLTTLATVLQKDYDEQSREFEHMLDMDNASSRSNIGKADPCNSQSVEPSLFLAGLHACGDLSVNMLRSFVDCKQVKVVVAIGCCYNLLSEKKSEKNYIPCGFPMSKAAKLSGFVLGKTARDLACQSAERWKSLTKNAVLQNFELHEYRAAFQMVLEKFFPEVLTSSPSIGRQGKALRRQQIRRVRESTVGGAGSTTSTCSISDTLTMKFGEDDPSTVYSTDVRLKGAQWTERSDRYMHFKKFSKSGLTCLGLRHLQDNDFFETWKEAQPFVEFIGPYWSLRAALGPVVETYILLDRLLFLQEQGDSVEASLFPLFDPTISPRNMAIIAQKK